MPDNDENVAGKRAPEHARSALQSRTSEDIANEQAAEQRPVTLSESGRPATIVLFPTPDEERARRLKVEVERLARLSTTEWIYYVESPGYAEKYGVDKATLKTMVEAVLKEIEKKRRNEQAEQRRIEGRAEKKQELEDQRVRRDRK